MIIRKDIFSHQSDIFTGCFLPGCKKTHCLKSVISLIFNGPNLKDQDTCESQACPATGQFDAFSTIQRKEHPILLEKRSTRWNESHASPSTLASISMSRPEARNSSSNNYTKWVLAIHTRGLYSLRNGSSFLSVRALKKMGWYPLPVFGKAYSLLVP